MKILVVSDAHGETGAFDKLALRVPSPDFTVFAGDFAAIGRPETGKGVLERLSFHYDRLFAVTGNADEPDFRETLEEYDVCVEGSLICYGGLMLAGSGGSSVFMRDTPNEREDEDLVSDLRLAAEASPGVGEPWDNLVVIAHNPPKDAKVDLIGSGAHVGSPLIRDFVEAHKPLLLVSGHIHEAFGVDSIGPTTVVNPGSIAEGRYALVELEGGKGNPYRVVSVSLETL